MLPNYQTGSSLLRRSSLHFILIVLLAVGISGCAGKLDKAANYYHADKPQQALDILQAGNNRDQLLYKLEQGLILQQIGKYQESIAAFRVAATLIDQHEEISISEQTSSLLVNDWLAFYSGEYSERLWVHTYLMMDYLLIGNFDGALVEAKLALEQLDKHPQALNMSYFTRALIALCYANVSENNGAYLVYQKLADDLANPALVAADIVKNASQMAMVDIVDKYKAMLPADLPAGDSELVLFISTGSILKKRAGNVVLPPSIRFSFPYYAGRTTPPAKLAITPLKWKTLPQLSTDMGAVAKAALSARKVKIIVKETLRSASKEAIAQAVGNNNDPTAEAVVRIALFLLENADTRAWQTLPGRLTLVRIPLPAGKHDIQIELINNNFGRHRTIELTDLKLNSGQRIFRLLKF